jgi:high-affinity nickel permease
MIEESLFAVIATGIIFGIVHAFDVDHIAAMATFSDQQKSEKTILKYAFKWGVGHGGILLALGLALIFVGFTLPQWFVHYAEVMVGVLLIYLGLKLVFLMHNKGLFNRSDSLSQQSAIPTKHDHTPLFIGMLHGVAGSAPLLALLPNMLETQFIFHISLFSVGCLFGMFSFGYLFGSYQVHIKNTKENVAKVLTKTLGFSSIGLGTFWVFS